MSSDRPNVLLIMTDQQPVSTIGCYGNSVVKTPAQDRLAREGMRFDNFYIAAFGQSPGSAALMRDRILSWLEETGHPYVNTIRELALREPS